MDAGHAEQIYGRPSMVLVHFGLRSSGESSIERYPNRNRPSGPLAALAGPLSSNRHLSVVSPQARGGQQHGTIERRPNRQGMMIAEVNVAIGAVDRILKMTKDGKSNNRELTNARAELDHWRARLLKAVNKGTP